MNIRFSTIKDGKKIQKFINDFWKKDHILSTSKKIFDFQYLGKDDQLNFVIAEENEEIQALLGFIPLSNFDENLEKNKDIWLAIWKAKEDAPLGLGLKLLNFLKKQYNPNTIGSIGINEDVNKIYQLLKYKTFTLNQYYISNEKLKDYKLIKIKKHDISNILTKEAEIRKIKNIDELNNISFSKNYRPFKSVNYIVNRYLKHPVYTYDILGAYVDQQLKNIYICRKIVVDELNSKCYRIIDIIGDYDFNYSLKNTFQEFLIDNTIEYVDCYNFGIDPLLFNKLGFKKVEDEIIPNYFEPFLKETVKIMSAVKVVDDYNYIVFKGDSDQDRPNSL